MRKKKIVLFLFVLLLRIAIVFGGIALIAFLLWGALYLIFM